MTGHGRIEPQPCGTWAAYQRHRRHREAIDDRCTAAAAAYQRHRLQWRETRGQVDQEHLIREAVRVLAEAML